MRARVNGLIIAGEMAVSSTRVENRLRLIADIRIEFTGKFRSW
jgi:hypothetical protein